MLAVPIAGVVEPTIVVTPLELTADPIVDGEDDVGVDIKDEDNEDNVVDGSDVGPAAVLLLVWPFTCALVCACAVAKANRTVATMTVRCIVLSCFEALQSWAVERRSKTNTRSIGKENEL